MVIKKLFIILIFFLFLININITFTKADNGEQVLYTGTVSPGTINISNKPAQFAISTNLVRLKYLDKIVVSSPGKCETNEGLIFCVDSISDFSASVKVIIGTAQLQIEKVLENKDYNVDELIPTKTIIKNVGKVAAKNVIFEEDVTNMTIINPIGCKLVENKLVYETSIQNKDSAFSCEYSFKIFQDGEVRKLVKINYSNGIENTVSTYSTTIRVKPFGFKFDSSLTNTKLNLDKENLIWFNFTSKSDRDALVRELSIEFPANLEVMEENGNGLVANKYTTKETVSKSTSIYKKFKVKVKSISSLPIKTRINFVTEKEYVQNSENEIKYNYLEPIITIRNTNFSSLEDINAVYIRNDNDFEIKDIEASLSSSKLELNPRKLTESNLGAKGYTKIGEFNFTAKEEKTSLPFFVDIKFKTKENMEVKLTKTFNIYINKTNKGSSNIQNQEASKFDKEEKESKKLESNQNKEKNNKDKVSFFCKHFGWLIESLCN